MDARHVLFVVIGVASIVAACRAAPGRRRVRSLPPWHVPCGESLEAPTAPFDDYQDEIDESLRSLRLQHESTLNNYLNSDYDYLYERVRIGIMQHQYVPNWLPGKKAVGAVKRLENATSRTIANNLPRLHTDLQKFAVAFEELVNDETDPRKQRALKTTQSYLLMMLCEVESNLTYLAPLQVPKRIQRGIMSQSERDPPDETRRMIRDWGIVLKYKNYLHAWRHVFDY